MPILIQVKLFEEKSFVHLFTKKGLINRLITSS